MPSHNTIDNWVRKCGLDELKHTPEELKDVDYAVVVDEYMMTGSHKLLPVLAVPAEHQGHPIKPNEAKVIGLDVKSRWTAKMVRDTIDANVETVGKKPLYVITDNDSKMSKAVKLSGYMWHRDISHTLAMFMERVYKKDPDFVEFNSKMAECKQQYCMKDVAYLQSPSQRTKARFMNLSEWVDWSCNMLRKYRKLSKKEQDVFSFIPAYASFIKEMKSMVSCIRHIEEVMKYEGLSKTTVIKCKHYVSGAIMRGNDRMRQVGRQILDYLAVEGGLLGDNDVVNNSSDIIESTLGTFKNIQSPNKLNGVTTLVLHLPVMMAFAEKSASKNYNVNVRLCGTRIKDIAKWKDDNLLENLVSKRINKLKRT